MKISARQINKLNRRTYKLHRKLDKIRGSDRANKPTRVTKPGCVIIRERIVRRLDTIKIKLRREYKKCDGLGDPKCYWRLQWVNLLSGAKQWTISTGSCESGNDPTTDTGNGFLGAFQWVLGTWHSAGGSGDPTDASWSEQAVRAWRWHLSHPVGQWPVCGE